MKKALHIVTTLDQPELLNSLVEKLARKRYDTGHGDILIPGVAKDLKSSTTETYVSGTVALRVPGSVETIHMPFITCFLFTCTRENSRDYKVTWSQSLS
jgi:hypothetical protein